ncbi:MAG: nuclear transport factor 2 family protein [Planctomycetota bacterium]
MESEVALVERFYQAFAARDSGAMTACYHPEVHFRDEVFDLQGAEASGMWRMLCHQGKDLKVQYSHVRVEGDRVHASWVADYTFGGQRQVHNQIEAQFRFRDGRIIEHVDRFDFHAWSRQALGVSGALFGWTGWLRAKVQKKAHSRLQAFLAKGA